MTLTATRPGVTVAELVAALVDQRQQEVTGRAEGEVGPAEVSGATTATPAHGEVPTVVVVGAHAGAGASSVAVALADVLAACETRAGLSGESGRSGGVCLVDAAPPESSGLICAAEHELGVDGSGWRVGSRRGVELRRPVRAVASPAEIPDLSPFAAGCLVVDAGWPLRDLVTGANPISPLLASARVVLVCRATIPGVRRAELALGYLPTCAVVVAVGARRLPPEVQASFGARLRTAYAAGRVVLAPSDRRMERIGVDSEPVPKAITAAGVRVLDLLWPRTPSNRRSRAEEVS